MADDVFPDRDMDHADKIAWVVETNGWCAEPVAQVEDPPTPGYTYSIGFEDTYDHPDVVIFGLQPVAARGLIEMLATHLAAGGTLPEGMFVGLLDNDLPSALLPLDMSLYAEMFPGATRYYGDEGCYRMSQFVWPDRAGRMPWDADYDERLRLAQPVVGT